MALNYVNGIISQFGQVESGTTQNGNSWSRQVVVLDVAGFGNTFSKIALTAQNQRVDELQNYQIGDRVEVGYSVTAREWNGKWFNNVDLIRIEHLVEQIPHEVYTQMGYAPQTQAIPNPPQAAPAAPAPRQAAKANSAYEVCEHFCSAVNCDYKLGTHGEACQRAMAAGQFTPPALAAQRRVARPARTTPLVPPGTNLEPQDDDLPC